MRVLPARQAPQQIPGLEEAVLWMLGAVTLALLLVGAFAFVLRRRRDWLGERLDALNRLLDRRAPRLGHVVRRRFSRDAWYGLTLTAAMVVCLSMIFLFAEITESWIDHEALYQVDLWVNQRLRGLLSDAAVRFFAVLTYLGGQPVALGASLALAIFLAVRKAWWRLVALGVVMGAGTGVMWMLKWVFGRQRPEGLLATPASASFPSGHAFTAVVFYGFLTYLVWRWSESRLLRWAATGALTIVIVSIGLSRILLSVHWTSDVLGGFTIGLAWLVFGLMVTRTIQAYVEDRAP